MTNKEIDEVLKSAAVPERPEEYWRQFPKSVMAKLHWRAGVSSVPGPARGIKPFLAWGLGFAAACIVAGFILQVRPSPVKNDQLAAVRKCYQEVEALFPNQVQAIVFDEQGTHLVLAAKADVPASPPLYLKVCGPKGCEGVVTFSGQQIPFNGENCEVLADANGKVMLVGNHEVWVGANPSGNVHVEAKPLNGVL
jgi:hypothetical protein